ncbi:SDR family NAD(P)-dependent oxidoreductase [Streptomyces hygroscopicus]|uniref:SDR family NAD(P)-dependent oxidoreductase n=1 Tax=Streptomyces hygroscopicus TaxID=1912 RepID=UPI0033D8225D
MRRFEGYAVMLTGAGRGIGEVTARRFADEGARVLITDLDGERAAKAAASIRADGGEAEALGCDAARRADAEAAVAHAVRSFGRLDVLVNSAHSCHADTPLFEDQPDDAWQQDIDVTLGGAFRCSRAALPHLAAAGGRGAIVNVGSVNGIQDFGNHAYSAAKAGLGSLTRTLAAHAAGRGVRVNLVAPGTIRTPGWDGKEDTLRRAAEVYPLGRVGEPTDIAAAITFLASSDAAWITGITLPVDGGITTTNVAVRRAFGHVTGHGEPPGEASS